VYYLNDRQHGVAASPHARWIDGRRSLRDVAALVEAEDGRRNVEAIVRHAALTALLEAGGMLEVVGRES